MKKVLVLFFLVLISLNGLASTSDLQLKILGYRNHYNKDENVAITIFIQNNGGNEIIMPALFIPEDYYVRFIVKDSSGQKVPFIGKEYKLKLSRSDLYTLKPGALIGQEINLKDFYDIKSGTYKVQAVFEIQKGYRNEKNSWTGKLISEEIQFIVN